MIRIFLHNFLLLHQIVSRFIFVLTLLLFFPHGNTAAEEIYPITFGFSQSILGANINANDATAAVKTWTRSLTETAAIPADPRPIVFDNLRLMYQAFEEETAEVFFITLPELYPVLNGVDDKVMLIPVTNGTTTEQYLLLANKSLGITAPKQLEGKDLIIFLNSRTSLAPYWLGISMAESETHLHKDFFTRVTKVSKLNDAVLPVFFNKAAACLVSKNGFETLAELNPQIAKQLDIILQSPEYVPSGLFFRKGYESPIKDRIISDLDEWLVSSSGKQLLTIFQLDNLAIENSSSLKSSLELLHKYEAIYSDSDMLKLHQ